MEQELLFKILSRLKIFRREIVAKDIIVPMWVNDSIEEIEAAQQSVQRTAVCGCADKTWGVDQIGLRCQVCREYIRR